MMGRRRTHASAACPVGHGVWQIRHSWGNAWVLAGGGDAILIDTGTVWDYPRIVVGLRAALGGRDPRTLKVLLTHGHTDHAGSAARLVARFGASVICHESEVPFVATRRTYVPSGTRALSPSGLLFAAGEVAFPVRRTRVDSALRDGDLVPTPVGDMRVMHTPGHTPGHVAYMLCDHGWLFSGDALINIIPFLMVVGLSLPPDVFTASGATMLESARQVVDMSPSGLLSGHGPAVLDGTAERLREFAASHIDPRRIRRASR